MKNTWLDLSEANNGMLQEDAKLLNYYTNGEFDSLTKRIEEISKAVLDEFWKPESFNHSEEYSEYMMSWKGPIESVIAKNVMTKVEKEYKNESLFNFIMLEILNNITIYNTLYTNWFYLNDE